MLGLVLRLFLGSTTAHFSTKYQFVWETSAQFFFCVLFPCCNARPFPPGLSFLYLSYMLRWRHDSHMFLQVFSACVTCLRIAVSQRPRHGLELLQETSRSTEVVGRTQVSAIMTDCNFINNVLITHPVLWTASNFKHRCFKINELVTIYI